MTHATTTRVQDHIGDPVSEAPAVPRSKLEEILKDIQSDLRYDHELHGCLNCGICTATCPAAHYYDFSPREIVQLLWTENLEGIYDAMQDSLYFNGLSNGRVWILPAIKLMTPGRRLSIREGLI